MAFLSPASWSSGNKLRFSVLAPDVIAGLTITPGAIFCMEKLLPDQTAAFKHFVAQKLIAPHLHSFEALTKNIRKANNERPDHVGSSLSAAAPDLQTARSEAIADALVRFSGVFLTDYAATLGMRKLFSQKLGIAGARPFMTSNVDFGVQLCTVALMPTLFAKLSTSLKLSISNIIHKTFGVDNATAEHFAMAVPYVAIPSLLGNAAAIAYATRVAGR